MNDAMRSYFQAIVAQLPEGGFVCFRTLDGTPEQVGQMNKIADAFEEFKKENATEDDEPFDYDFSGGST